MHSWQSARPYGGVLLVDKPIGLSSFRAVAVARRALAVKKVGHGGTLDPLATGLLILFIGSGTKLASSIIGYDKVYDARIRLGMATLTDDREGAVIRQLPWENVDEKKILSAISQFLGKQSQIPPQFSAKKVAGQRAYTAARRGNFVSLTSCNIHIYQLILRRCQLPFIDVHIHCSKGTYVRAVVRDFGEWLGCGAHLHALRRTNVGHFSIENALHLDQLEYLTSTELLSHMDKNSATLENF
ncbi:MAG: tRNA pseudouridine(55) synthase TruB [Puniceicoccales bacterium]|jgi:tRNA pseudouridine55 synthase|nr:tRNA pseudouridine(55) synthase TruB [Puniceicoccales bacterium]